MSHLQTAPKAVVSSEQTAAVTFSSDVAANSLIVFASTFYDDSAMPTITAGMLTKTAGTSTIGTIQLDAVVQGFEVNTGERIGLAIWSCLVTGAGSLTLTLNVGSPNTFYFFCAASEFSGTWDSSRAATPATSSTTTDNTTSAASGNVSTTGAGVIVGVLAPYASANPFTMTEDGAFTSAAVETNFASYMGGEIIYRVVASATTDSADWTIGSTNGGYAVGAVAYNEVASGGTTLTPDAATLTMTGATPTVTTTGNADLTPAAASLAMTGATPTVTAQAYTWYALPAPGAYDSNSILAGQTYPTGSWLRVVTAFAHITYDYAAAEAAGELDNDINDHATAESGYTGSDSATYEIKTPAGATAQYTVTANITDTGVSLGPSAATLTMTGASPTVTVSGDQTVTPAAATLTMTGNTPSITGTTTAVQPAAASMVMTGGQPYVVNGALSNGENLVAQNVNRNVARNAHRRIAS